MLRFRQRLVRRVFRDDRGITGVEYGLIIALIATGIIGVVTVLGHVLGSGYTSAADAVPSSGAPATATATPGPGSADAGPSGAEATGGTAGSGAPSAHEESTKSPDPSTAAETDEADAQTRAEEAAKAEEAVKAEVQAKADEAAKAEEAAKAGEGKRYECVKAGQWYDESAGTCEASAKASCVGDQTFDENANNCVVPKCEGKAYDAKSGTCVESAAKTCQANKEGYSEETNSCYTCPVGFDGATGTCVPQKDCAADNRIPNSWNICLTVDEYVGTLQGASLSSVGNGWLPQSPGTTKTYSVFSAKDTKSWKDEPWLLSVTPYSAEIISATVSDPSSGLTLSSIPTPTFTADTLTITTPEKPKWAQYTVTYTVQVTYPWNGSTKTATKTVSTKVGLQ